MVRGVLSILWKEIRLEYHSRGSIAAMLLFLGVLLLLFGLAFPTGVNTETLPGVLWISILFSGILGLGRSFRQEIPEALLLAPVPRSAVFWGKFAANLLFLIVVEVVAIPLVLAFYNLPGPADWLKTVAALFLGTVGMVAVGTLVLALTAGTAGGDMLLPLLLFPLLVPDLAGGIQATVAGFQGDAVGFWVWAKVLLAYDVIFLTVPGFLLEFILEG